jgi:hypothetical protein
MARTEDSHVAKLGETRNAATGSVVDQVDTALPELYPVVSVRNESPALGTGQCVALSTATPVKALLPQDPRRRHALILAVDNDVWIASTREIAQAAEGSTAGSVAFYLPKGIAIPVINKGAWYAAATAAGTSRISVMVDKDDT